MKLIENNINSFHGAHPTHVSSLVDMKLIPPRGFGISMDQGASLCQ